MTEARKDRRAPASIKVKYKSASMTEFVELLGGDVSRGGIFIKTKKPLEPGALLKFEFQLQSGEAMISGVGRVAWRRTEEGARPTLPAGMGIKFIKLNGQSRLVIDRIEAKHGPGSRFEQTDGAEIASSMSSLPPSSSSSSTFGAVTVSAPPDATGTLVTPLRPEATRAAAEADAAATPRLRPDSANLNSPGRYSMTESGRPTRSSPPLREARTSGPKPSAAAMAATFRPPPPATDSVPPPHSSASSQPPASAAAARSANPAAAAVDRAARSTAKTSFTRSSSGAFASPSVGSARPAVGSAPAGVGAAGSGVPSSIGSPSAAAPRGVLGSGAGARRSGAAIPSTRSAARDASEFLASTFTVGGAGREVRSEAHAQVERARQDPHSVDLANELFGDLNEPANKAQANAALDADPMLSERPPLAAADAASAAHAAETRRPEPAAVANDVAPVASQRLRSSPRPQPTAAREVHGSDQLKLSLGGTPTDRPGTGGGRALWLAGIAIVGVGIGAAVFYLQRPAPESAVPPPAAQPEVAAAPPVVEPPTAAPPPAAAVPAQPVPVSWTLSSLPAGAELSVDGTASGKTPATLKLMSGTTIQLSLRSPGYLPKNESVEVLPDMAERTIELEHLPYELVVKQPVGATVRVLDKSAESPAPLSLGVPFPGPTALGEINVSVQKDGFQVRSRKLTSADFRERDGVFRAELSLPLTPLPAAAKAAAPKAPIAKVVAAPAANKPASDAPPESQAPPEPENAAPAEKPAAIAAAPAQAAPPKEDKPAEAAPPAAPAPQAQAPTPAPTPAPPSDVPAEP